MTDFHFETSTLYNISALLVSAASVMLAAIYMYREVYNFRKFHDERSAVGLFKSSGLLVMAIGLATSSIGLATGVPVVYAAGLSFSRGAFLVLLITLVVADTKPKK